MKTAPCITTVPLRVKAAENSVFSDLVVQVQTDFQAIMEHQHTPLRMIQRWTGVADLFDVLFNLTRRTGRKSNHTLWKQMDSKATLDVCHLSHKNLVIQTKILICCSIHLLLPSR